MFRLLVWLIPECLANLKVDQILCGVAQATEVRRHSVDVRELASGSESPQLLVSRLEMHAESHFKSFPSVLHVQRLVLG